MYKSSLAFSTNCAQTPELSTAIRSHFLGVGNVSNFYPQYEQFMHIVFTTKSTETPLLLSLFTQNTHSLLLKLLIYLKKGY